MSLVRPVTRAVLRIRAGQGRPPITELTSFLCRRFAPHKMPVYWAFRDELPLTPSGKIQKFVLREDLVKGLLTFDETRPGELTAHEPPVR